MIDDVECNLPVTVLLPLDYCTPVLYPLAYLITSLAFNYAAFFVMTNDVIMQAHLMHLLCQYAVLVDCFENVLFDCEEEFKGKFNGRKLNKTLFVADLVEHDTCVKLIVSIEHVLYILYTEH